MKPLRATAGMLFATVLSCGAAQQAAGADEQVPLDEQVRLLVLGDSLTAGYGLAPEDGFTSQLQAALRDAGLDVVVLNAGVSGDTTAGGLARLDWSLADNPTHVLVELGSNDALRGIDPAEAQSNLDAIVSRLIEEDVPVMLAGMYAPPNWGSAYSAEFNAIYPGLAERYDVPLYPFFLEGVAMDPDLNQRDGIHPNTTGVEVIVDNIVPDLLLWLAPELAT